MRTWFYKQSSSTAWGFQHARRVDFSFFHLCLSGTGARQGPTHSPVTKYPSGRADDEHWRSAGWTCAQRSVKLTDDITPGGHVPTVCSLFPVTFLMPPDHAHLFIYIACSFVYALGLTTDPWHNGTNIFWRLSFPFSGWLRNGKSALQMLVWSFGTDYVQDTQLQPTAFVPPSQRITVEFSIPIGRKRVDHFLWQHFGWMRLLWYSIVSMVTGRTQGRVQNTPEW